MATEGSSAGMGGRSASGGATADSYIGSVISLTSKSEIRYEGILYNINTDESSIGLQNVRSFGTEGRKKDGPQVPPSDKIYEYILFRGSDIKDLQVKSSPAIQSTPPINTDPAIIQSHFPHPMGQPSSLPNASTLQSQYPYPTAQPSSLLTASGGSLSDHSSNISQTGIQGSNFQGGLPLYQPGGNLNSWNPSPPNSNAGGLPMPMYWQRFYGASGGLPQLPQQSMLVPSPGYPTPSAAQQMQLPGFGSHLPLSMSSLPSSVLPDHPLAAAAPSIPKSSSLTSNPLPLPNLPLSSPPLQTGLLAPDTSSSFQLNKAPVSSNAALMPISNLSHFSKLPSSVSDISGALPVSIKTMQGPPVLGTQQNIPPQQTAVSALNGVSVVSDAPMLPLVTPGQLLQPAVGASTQILQTVQKDVEVVQVSSNRPSEPLVRVETEAQPPLLPSLPNTRTQKSNGSSQNTQNNRVRGGRAHMMTRPVTKFTEDFDFTAMNEKFNKDEVWGNLGKGIKNPSKDKEVCESGNAEEEMQDEDDLEPPKVEMRPSYNKDDFFDTLSCNPLDTGPNHGRTRYSEQMKLDTETFGEFSRYHGGRGGRGSYRGGRGGHGSYRGGRGYGGGRSHSYMVRGRGRSSQDRFS